MLNKPNKFRVVLGIGRGRRLTLHGNIEKNVSGAEMVAGTNLVAHEPLSVVRAVAPRSSVCFSVLPYTANAPCSSPKYTWPDMIAPLPKLISSICSTASSPADSILFSDWLIIRMESAVLMKVNDKHMMKGNGSSSSGLNFPRVVGSGKSFKSKNAL